MRTRMLPLLVLVSLAAAACTPSEESASTSTSQPVATPATTSMPPPSTTTTAPPERVLDPDGFYLMLMYHQHQPLYPKDAAGVVTRPWVRAHAAKDYYDMAALLGRYPDVHATINLTPVLMLQLEEIMNGSRDVYWTLSETPVADLDDDQKQFIRDRFFDTNRKIVARFPRYQELLDKNTANRSFTDADYRDLQLLWNLAWTDPSFLAEEPLASLAAKGRDFSREDIDVVLEKHLEIVSQVFDIHRELWDAGQIEVTTTPLAHPILPLISDSTLAAQGDPSALLPTTAFQEVVDSTVHVERGLAEAERLLGRRPVGMWPGEGAVAQNVMGIFSSRGVEWVATGEDVLAKTLDVDFTRDAGGALEQPEVLYRPYAAQLRRNPPVAMFFRDLPMSDALGFTYSGESAETAVNDFMQRLRTAKEAMEAQGVGGPKVVSVILDGENAWEHYDNDGIDFLSGLYQALSDADFVETVTPSELLAAFPSAPAPLPDVYPAAWFSPNYATWIGEAEEAIAWEYLGRVRQDLRAAQGDFPAAQLADAYDVMLFAEGSDWFWWYGSDQDSGDDAYFDRAFRELLGQVYDELGAERPAFIRIPIVPAALVEPDRAPQDIVTIEIDNRISDVEWQAAGRYELAGETMRAVDYGFDTDNLYVRVEFGGELLGAENAGFDLYIDVPSASSRFGLTTGGEVLGFNASHRLSWRSNEPLVVTGGPYAEAAPDPSFDAVAGFDGDEIEFSVSLESLGTVGLGDRVRFRIVDVTSGPESGIYPPGPGFMQVPDISNVEVIAAFTDPEGDDHGPGTYTYPTDGVFVPASYDLTAFTVGTEGADLVFEFDVRASIQNPWNSPRDFSIQTYDVYIDTDPGAGTGVQMMIDGRNAALEDGAGWEYAITLEGWDPALYVAAADGAAEETKPTFTSIVINDQGKVIARFARALFGDSDPAGWGYAVAVLSQEGFPSPGVRRVRDIDLAAQQFRFGGSAGAANETRIIDLLHPDRGVQEGLLSALPTVASTLRELTPTDVARIPLLVAQ